MILFDSEHEYYNESIIMLIRILLYFDIYYNCHIIQIMLNNIITNRLIIYIQNKIFIWNMLLV